MTITAAAVGPQQYTGRYAPAEASAPQSRRDLKDALNEWGLQELTDNACLIVSELVANAVRHCRSGAPIEVSVLRPAHDVVRISVMDQCPTPAAVREAPPTDESGRGLFLVEAVSSSWGSEQAPQGKVVWAEIRAQ